MSNLPTFTEPTTPFIAVDSGLPEVVRKAKQFAIGRYGDWGCRPYIDRLNAIASIASQYGDEPWALAYLHEMLDKSMASADDIRWALGDRILECVQELTPVKDNYTGVLHENEKLKWCSNASVLITVAACNLGKMREYIKSGESYLAALLAEKYPPFMDASRRPGMCDAIWGELDSLVDNVQSLEKRQEKHFEQPPIVETQQNGMVYTAKQHSPDEWIVTAIGSDGEMYSASFWGHAHELLAKEYAEWKNSCR